jgi:hypothetical protein
VTAFAKSSLLNCGKSRLGYRREYAHEVNSQLVMKSHADFNPKFSMRMESVDFASREYADEVNSQLVIKSHVGFNPKFSMRMESVDFETRLEP